MKSNARLKWVNPKFSLSTMNQCLLTVKAWPLFQVILLVFTLFYHHIRGEKQNRRKILTFFLVLTFNIWEMVSLEMLNSPYKSTWFEWKKMQRTLESQGKIEYINTAFNKKLNDYHSQLQKIFSNCVFALIPARSSYMVKVCKCIENNKKIKKQSTIADKIYKKISRNHAILDMTRKLWYLILRNFWLLIPKFISGGEAEH